MLPSTFNILHLSSLPSSHSKIYQPSPFFCSPVYALDTTSRSIHQKGRIRLILSPFARHLPHRSCTPPSSTFFPRIPKAQPCVLVRIGRCLVNCIYLPTRPSFGNCDIVLCACSYFLTRHRKSQASVSFTCAPSVISSLLTVLNWKTKSEY